jgi:hypothetical protein
MAKVILKDTECVALGIAEDEATIEVPLVPTKNKDGIRQKGFMTADLATEDGTPVRVGLLVKGFTPKATPKDAL